MKLVLYSLNKPMLVVEYVVFAIFMSAYNRLEFE